MIYICHLQFSFSIKLTLKDHVLFLSTDIRNKILIITPLLLREKTYIIKNNGSYTVMYETQTEKFAIVIVLWLAIDIFVHERGVQQYSYLFLSCCTIWACGITITKLCFLTLETFYGFQNQELDPQQQLWQHHHNPIVLWVTLEGRRGFVNTFWEVFF